LWLFIAGVVGFKTIQSDTLPKYAGSIVFMLKESVADAFRPPEYHSIEYGDDEEDEEKPYIHSHTGRE